MPLYTTKSPDAQNIEVYGSLGQRIHACLAVDTDNNWADVCAFDKDGRVFRTWKNDKYVLAILRIYDKFTVSMKSTKADDKIL